MAYNFDANGLYLMNEEVEITNEAPTTSEPSKPNKPAKPVSDTKVYALPLGKKELAELDQIIKSGSGIWKTDIPLKPYKGGPNGQPARIDNKYVYLALRINSKKEIRREEADRVYIVSNISADELQNDILDVAINELDAASIFPKLPDGKTTHTVKIWKTKEQSQSKPDQSNIDLGKEIDKMTI